MAISMTKFRSSLQSISNNLSKDDVRSLVFLSRDLLNDETVANSCHDTGSALDFFEAMLRRQLYSPSNCKMLLDHLHSIKRLDLVNEVKASLGLQQGRQNMPAANIGEAEASLHGDEDSPGSGASQSRVPIPIDQTARLNGQGATEEATDLLHHHPAEPVREVGLTTVHPVQATADENLQTARKSNPTSKPPPVPPKKPYHLPRAQPGRQNMPAAKTGEAEASLHGDKDSPDSGASQSRVPIPIDQTARVNGQGATEEVTDLLREVSIGTHENKATSHSTACTAEAQTVEEYELLRLSHDLPVSKLNPLGQELGFSAARVSHFQYDNSCNISVAFFQILVAWKNNQGLSSNIRKHLATHLENIDCEALADHLRMETYRQK